MSDLRGGSALSKKEINPPRVIKLLDGVGDSLSYEDIPDLAIREYGSLSMGLALALRKEDACFNS